MMKVRQRDHFLQMKKHLFYVEYPNTSDTAGRQQLTSFPSCQQFGPMKIFAVFSYCVTGPLQLGPRTVLCPHLGRGWGHGVGSRSMAPGHSSSHQLQGGIPRPTG